MTLIKSLCVYCGSARGRSPRFVAAAKELGEAMAQRQIRLVYGGARIGMMGEVADAVMKNGGQVVGVIPEHLQTSEVGHSGITELKVVESMHVRKKLMFDLSDGFAVLPGGYGTLDELFEALTLVQTGKTRQMPIILVNEPYWRGLITWMRERLAGEGMIGPNDLDLLQVFDQPQDVVDAIFAFYAKRGFAPSPAEREVLLNL
jgi:uncharacterized protein (TIGR00730 family)